MRTLLTTTALLLAACVLHAQTPIITAWKRNTAGKVATYYYNNGGMPISWTWTVSTDSADVLKVAYTADSVWIRSNGLTDSMGKYLNPGGCVAQAYIHRFPRTPSVPATKTISPKGGAIGLLLNGVPIYGLGNSASYTGSGNANNGQGVWNVEVGKSEGFVLDSNYGAHPQQQGGYHSHDNPYRLYRDSGSTKHSPLIGFAFDGHPVYGPYGYASAMNAASGIARMKTGYSLRNITTRTTLPTIPNGGGTASQTGPPVNTTYPLGTYVEDYEWLSANGGDLDRYNGRTCVTPEFPQGTYAYFVTIDAVGKAAFPYYIGIYYYGQPVTANAPPVAGSLSNGLSIPGTAAIYTGGVVLAANLLTFSARSAGTGNRLEWELAGTDDVARMDVERSDDGFHFYPLGTRLPQQGDAASPSRYNFDDETPIAWAYYRIRIAEHSGSQTQSSVALVRRAETAGTARVYPTCTSTTVHVERTETDVPQTVLCLDATGRLMATHTLAKDERQLQVDVSTWPSGMYLFRCGTEALPFFKH